MCWVSLMPSGADLKVSGHAAALAKSAREKLALALAELQRHGAPDVCLSNAGSIAKAMGLLLSYEERRERRFADEALAVVRESLAKLQSVGDAHPALGQAASKVAASLGLLHSVGELANVGRDRGAAPPNSTADILRMHGAPSATADATDTAKTRLSGGSKRPGSPSLERRVQPWEEVKAPSLAALEHRYAHARQSLEATRRKRIEAALGMHSHTNFYRGLGEDFAQSGGLFVATYDIPTRDEKVSLKVNMPGGYEFEAEGIVRWTRELPTNGTCLPDISPGFGVQFTCLPEAARRLVERYMRHRDPIFHD